MEINVKNIVYINILLLTVQLTCNVSSASLITANPDDQTKISATVSADNTSSIQIEPTTRPVLLEDAAKYDVLNAIANTSDFRNNTQISGVVNESKLETEKREGEIDDLQHGGKYEDVLKTIDEDDLVILPKPIDNDEQAPTSETEWIEEDYNDMDNEDVPPFVQAMTVTSSSQVQQYAFQGQLAMIVAAFLMISLAAGYVGYVAWRRFIEQRYGNRQVLVNEDDMIDPNDMKHFSL